MTIWSGEWADLLAALKGDEPCQCEQREESGLERHWREEEGE